MFNVENVVWDSNFISESHLLSLKNESSSKLVSPVHVSISNGAIVEHINKPSVNEKNRNFIIILKVKVLDWSRRFTNLYSQRVVIVAAFALHLTLQNG